MGKYTALDLGAQTFASQLSTPRPSIKCFPPSLLIQLTGHWDQCSYEKLTAQLPTLKHVSGI